MNMLFEITRGLQETGMLKSLLVELYLITGTLFWNFNNTPVD